MRAFVITLLFALVTSLAAFNFQDDDEAKKLIAEYEHYINTPWEERPQEDHHPRHKRQLMELLSSVGSSGGSGIMSVLPGFSDYGPAFMSLLNNFLGFMKCCAPLNLPDVVSKLTLKCSDDLSNNFFATTGFLNRSETGTHWKCVFSWAIYKFKFLWTFNIRDRDFCGVHCGVFESNRDNIYVIYV
ncbi:Hypothetical predicted protein [Cloeon dipterum]|uniref:Uncharacterized protein n=1 Tax=Cloeon dipterum TaxID=197152 RepID=A0A8S1D5L1_9INSE|nr:Hypothetical predicted protein [Cloeon dipterum]